MKLSMIANIFAQPESIFLFYFQTRHLFVTWWFQTPIAITEGLDFLNMLTDEADIAAWSNEGLPSDRMSTENATILVRNFFCIFHYYPKAWRSGYSWTANKYCLNVD